MLGRGGAAQAVVRSFDYPHPHGVRWTSRARARRACRPTTPAAGSPAASTQRGRRVRARVLPGGFTIAER